MAATSILDNWTTLNETIVSADEKTCIKLLHAELAGKRRHRFVMRIHSRLNRVRADRERLELDRLVASGKGTWNG